MLGYRDVSQLRNLACNVLESCLWSGVVVCTALCVHVDDLQFPVTSADLWGLG